MSYDPKLAALLSEPWSNGACRGYVIMAMEGVFVIRVFHIAIRGIRADKLTVAAFHIKYLPDFL